MTRITHRRTTAATTSSPLVGVGGDPPSPPLALSFTERHLLLGILLVLVVLLLLGVAVGQLLGHLAADLLQAALP